MDSHNKVNEYDQEGLNTSRKKTRKRITIITLSSVILVVVIVSAVCGTSLSRGGGSGGGRNDQSLSNSMEASICDITLYPETCKRSLAPLIYSTQIQPKDIYKLSVQLAINELSKASRYFSENGGFKGISTDKMAMAALETCHELLDLALDHLNISLSATDLTSLDTVDDLKTWLSSAGTFQQTCIDGFENATTSLQTTISNYLKTSTELTSNGLAVITAISDAANSLKRRRLLGDEMPEWLGWKERRLLESESWNTTADAVVAKDGSGKYKRISDALKAVPDKGKKRFVIYVKKGVYYENVRVEKNKWNVMMVGDGMEVSVVSGNLSFGDGIPTFSTATFAVFGQGFIARDMGFCNTAGAINQQAVALMSTSDLSVFYRCRIDAFQDTLYTLSNRQFYRECNIYGTVDFIFGNSAVVIQNSNILPKVPTLGQQNTITAQGKLDPNQNTGISIQNCTIGAAGSLDNVQTFLGRPWKNYSTTVYMQNMMGNLIDPKGWLPWMGHKAPDTIFYAEFQNFGQGSLTKNRVNWKGVRKITSKQVSKFTVTSFIKGNKWINATGVQYNPGL